MLIIVDYGVGNLGSIQNMLKKGRHVALISSDINTIDKATKIILPGMGSFDNCMSKLESSGLKSVINRRVIDDKIPVLGICVGMQMFMKSSEEGNLPGLNWISGKTVRFDVSTLNSNLKIPNMGWHETKLKKDSRLIEDLHDARFYHAHSFHVKLDNTADALLTTNYGYEYVSAVENGNILGVQFHPEKSHRFGLKLLQNFAEYY